ncbi:MAG: glycosyltransferase [Bacteroidetes bacterium B1(2017)]|nr:MAG: glycosyltransferase [Bacteroidetes bacterium B1(2017)]
MSKQPVLLVIGSVWPEPNSSAAGARMLDLLSKFLKEKWKIVFACTAQESPFMADLGSFGMESMTIHLNDSSFDAYAAELNPNVVLFDRFLCEEQFGWRIAKECPNALRVLETVDLHFLRYARELAWKEGNVCDIRHLQSDRAKREIASILRCDCSIIISEYEMNLLQGTFRVDPKLLLYYPLIMDGVDSSNKNKLPSYEDRRDFIFIGNFWHEPNWQALRELKLKIWPRIHAQLPMAELHVYGAYPSKKVTDLNQVKDKFFVHGRADDAKELVKNARVCLAPMPFGAGLKGKLLEAMACGTPSITNHIGSEGMNGEFEWPGYVTASLEEFADKAVLLYTQESEYISFQQKGFTILDKRFNKNEFESVLFDQVLTLMENIEKHRQDNFIGEILHHHTLASTMYMSKWIEAKNT